MLKNQLADLRKDSEYRKTFAEWETSLEAEIRALESDAYRLPWYGRLPEQMESSLQPFQDRLNQSYSEMCNALETGPGIR
jgi:hypothetical protein